ncbi:sigma-70 family RNA polymerase sigma factor [Halalkalibacter alkaliphilus]|uniref:RNA polymerase sigma factor n=1 Tax=Halalkalibacter alkaliphilus TaxID=2917993 RepID=A0A9X1ZWH3_9BACI|nr:sigma-70 family RNA polymerase sigma factor [Halalkalibacter alkaliphilus]MCL7746799.1 sigma-70 family RNA polymerase sigma factor [Halalkalibacter alkaliphilus]
MSDLLAPIGDLSRMTEKEKEDLLEVIIHTYGKQVTNFAYTYVKDWGIAEDVAQDVFIKVFQHLHQFRKDSSLKTWIYQITANHCKDLLRKKYFQSTFLTDLVGQIINGKAVIESSEHTFLQVNQEKEMAKQVLHLPVKYREIMILYYYEELSTEEIGTFLQISVSTVKTRLQRGRERLKRRLKGGDWLG